MWSARQVKITNLLHLAQNKEKKEEQEKDGKGKEKKREDKKTKQAKISKEKQREEKKIEEEKRSLQSSPLRLAQRNTGNKKHHCGTEISPASPTQDG